MQIVSIILTVKYVNLAYKTTISSIQIKTIVYCDLSAKYVWTSDDKDRLTLKLTTTSALELIMMNVYLKFNIRRPSNKKRNPCATIN